MMAGTNEQCLCSDHTLVVFSPTNVANPDQICGSNIRTDHGNISIHDSPSFEYICIFVPTVDINSTSFAQRVGQRGSKSCHNPEKSVLHKFQYKCKCQMSVLKLKHVQHLTIIFSIVKQISSSHLRPLKVMPGFILSAIKATYNGPMLIV